MLGWRSVRTGLALGVAFLSALLVLAVAHDRGNAAPQARAASPSSDWLGFGRTPDQNRHSPLTAITPANVSTLQRLYTVDFRGIDSSIKNGEQSYPLEIGGVLYLTTNDDNVWACLLYTSPSPRDRQK